jgi:putative endonuclease
VLRKRKNSEFGRIAENYAVSLLESKGYKIIGRNFRSRFGEIDIIALKDNCLIFVEVKARWSRKFGAPEEAVTASKLWKIKRTGEYFCLLNPTYPKKLRIEVIALVIEDGVVTSSKIIGVY